MLAALSCATARLEYTRRRLSVRPFITEWYHVKKNGHKITLFSPSDCPVFDISCHTLAGVDPREEQGARAPLKAQVIYLQTQYYIVVYYFISLRTFLSRNSLY